MHKNDLFVHNSVVLCNLMLLNSDSLARTRIHKVFYPCNRCHLATLLENQRVTCDNEVTRVTRNGVFALNIHSTLRYGMWVAKISQFSVPPYGTSYSSPWNKVFHSMEQSVPPHGTNKEVPPLRGEGSKILK